MLTFAILPGCVPGQAEKRREKNKRSGNRSISEPHLIAAIDPPSPSTTTTHGDPGAAVPLLTAFGTSSRQGVGECIWWPPTTTTNTNTTHHHHGEQQ